MWEVYVSLVSGGVASRSEMVTNRLTKLHCTDSRCLTRSQYPKTQKAEGVRGPTPLLDSHQPFHYEIRFAKRSFTLDFYDTAYPNQHWSTLKPDVVVLAFDISNRETLSGLKAVRPLRAFFLSYFLVMTSASNTHTYGK